MTENDFFKLKQQDLYLRETLLFKNSLLRGPVLFLWTIFNGYGVQRIIFVFILAFSCSSTLPTFSVCV